MTDSKNLSIELRDLYSKMQSHFYNTKTNHFNYKGMVFDHIDTADENSELMPCDNRIIKNWGHELIIYNSSYCMKYLYVYKDEMCSIHYHELKDEIFHMIKGSVMVELWFPKNFNYYKDINDDEKKNYLINNPTRKVHLYEGRTLHINPMVAHRFTGLADENIIIECSTTDYTHDSKRILNSPEKR